VAGARRSPITAVITGVIGTLRGNSAITALVGSSTAVYNNVEPKAAYPYLVVTTPTDTPADTMGRFGVSTLVDVRAVSQYAGDKEAADLIDASITALHFQRPTITGHTVLGTAFENGERFQEVINGVITRHHVATFRIWTEQSSS
jgi:hypothetical protein